MSKALKDIADEESKKSSSSGEEKKGESKGSSNDEKQKYVDLMSGFKFDELTNFRAHHYTSKHASEADGVSRAWTRRLATEYSDLSKSLPINYDSSVFMRVHESKMSFAQVLILAPDNTPYGRGAFLFDVFFPATYPNTPPLVNLQTTGSGSVRFNPNLYNCGKVCLSLLGTWRGQAGESWNPKTSTFLQVAVSIQSLIFVPQPYFNEPGYERDMGTSHGQQRSDEYNRNIQIQTVRFAMIDQMKNPPPGFEKIIQTHFAMQKNIILQQVEDWAKSNSGLKTYLPELKGLLEKQKAADK
jgi:baculoviral IAP repeat-containing protein 6